MSNPPCKVGDRIELVHMPDDPDPIPDGSKGRVILVSAFYDGTFQIVVDWGCKRSLRLVYPTDQFRVIEDDT